MEAEMGKAKGLSMRICAMVLSVAVLVLMTFTMSACGGKNSQGVPGPAGEKGADGLTPFVGANGNWWIGEVDTGIAAAGRNGLNGEDGASGADGKDGVDGVDGQDGADAITPQFSYDAESGDILVSYDEGQSWATLVNVGSMVADGKDGTSISSCSINSLGELVVKYSDGTSDNLGKIVARDGVGIDGVSMSENGTLTIILSNGTQYQFEGLKGEDGVNGNDGFTPQFRINGESRDWEISYDGGDTWQTLGSKSTGEPGADGISPEIRINADGYWEICNDGTRWITTDVKAIGADGSNGEKGEDGRGILSIQLWGNYLHITYTDGKMDKLGPISDGSNVGENVGAGAVVDVYTASLAFYPLGDGSEYGVSIGNAIYMENIIIPSTYNGKPVTTILPGAFYDGENYNTNLKSVTIPSSIVKIGDYAFEGCTALEEIYIPASVCEIGEVAFGVNTEVHFEIAEADVPINQTWTVATIGGKEIKWER